MGYKKVWVKEKRMSGLNSLPPYQGWLLYFGLPPLLTQTLSKHDPVFNYKLYQNGKFLISMPLCVYHHFKPVQGYMIHLSVLSWWTRPTWTATLWAATQKSSCTRRSRGGWDTTGGAGGTRTPLCSPSASVSWRLPTSLRRSDPPFLPLMFSSCSCRSWWDYWWVVGVCLSGNIRAVAIGGACGVKNV